MQVHGEFFPAPACSRQVQAGGGVAAISPAISLCRLCTECIGGSGGETEGQRDGESAGGSDSIPPSLVLSVSLSWQTRMSAPPRAAAISAASRAAWRASA